MVGSLGFKWIEPYDAEVVFWHISQTSEAGQSHRSMSKKYPNTIEPCSFGIFVKYLLSISYLQISWRELGTRPIFPQSNSIFCNILTWQLQIIESFLNNNYQGFHKLYLLSEKWIAKKKICNNFKLDFLKRGKYPIPAIRDSGQTLNQKIKS